jgi:hypothetical protein
MRCRAGIQSEEVAPGYYSRQFKGTPPYWYQVHLVHVQIAVEMSFSTLHYRIVCSDIVSITLMFSEETFSSVIPL